MSDQPLVSIIIPTHNRAHLIGETLDSICDQTYDNWECIIVDDGSSDNTDEVVDSDVQKDSRFRYFHRPEEHLSGGNGARNYGFEVSQGEYVNWFDSDDLMKERFLQSKVEFANENEIDFSISQTVNFTDKNTYLKIKKYKLNSKNHISLLNFINQHIYWMTPDFFVRRKIVKAIDFSEKLKSGQETNFFIKFLTLNAKGRFLGEVLTLRRIHEDSIRKSIEVNEVKANKYKSLSLLDAYFFIFKNVNGQELTALENQIVRAMYRAEFDVPKQELTKFTQRLKQHRGFFQSINFQCLIFFKKINKGYFFFNKFQNYG